jgi:protein transport protein SEC24
MLAPRVQTVANAERVDLINSTNIFFAQQGSELAHNQISVDIFLFNHERNIYKNLQTFADLARKSSGSLYYYPGFNARTNSLKFSNELYHNLTRNTAWEAVFRVRVSNGYHHIAQMGNLQIKAKTNDLIICPTIDCDRTICYEIERNQQA